MRVLGYTWGGVRTANLQSTAQFFAEALGLSLIHEDHELIQFEMPSGSCSRSSVREVVIINFTFVPFWPFKWRMCVRPGRSWSHKVSSSSRMSMATN